MILAATSALMLAIIAATTAVIFRGWQIPKQPGESHIDRSIW